MNVFDLNEIAAFPYEQREKNVFYRAKEFKTRIIELPTSGEMPTCEVASHVVSIVLMEKPISALNLSKQL